MSVVYLVPIQLENKGHILSLLAQAELEHLPLAEASAESPVMSTTASYGAPSGKILG